MAFVDRKVASVKKLVIITGDFPPTNIVGALRPFRLAKKMLHEGWHVDIITRPPRLGQELDRDLVNELSSNCTVHYIKSSLQHNNSYFFYKRLKTYFLEVLRKVTIPDVDIFDLPYYWTVFRKVNNRQPPHVVLSTSPSHSIHVAALLINSRYKIPWIVDLRDPWDDFVITGKSTIKNPIERYLEQKVISLADSIVSTTENYTNILANRHPYVPRDKFHTITNSFDQTKIVRNPKKSNDKFIICYTGIFYPSKNPYIFFTVLKQWFESLTEEEVEFYRKRIEIHLIGSGCQSTRKVIGELELQNNVIIFERMPHDKAIEMTCRADMALISTGQGEKTRKGWLPSKLFEYLGCRISILAIIREGEMADIIRKTNSGYVVTENVNVNVKTIISKEVARKFKLPSDEQEEFTFNGVECFEESQVMQQFYELIDTKFR